MDANERGNVSTQGGDPVIVPISGALTEEVGRVLDELLARELGARKTALVGEGDMGVTGDRPVRVALATQCLDDGS